MIIRRTVNGQDLEFALTENEMIEAYYEQEAPEQITSRKEDH